MAGNGGIANLVVNTIDLSQNDDIIGFSSANNVTDSNNDIDFTTSDLCRLWNSTLTSNIKPTAGTITKKLDEVFAVGTNQGGLDTGTKAVLTRYYMFMIWKIDLTFDYLFSTSMTSPTLPLDYVYFRRLPGFLYTDSSGNILGYIDNKDGRFTFKNRYLVHIGAGIAARLLVSTILPPFFDGDFMNAMYSAYVGAAYNHVILFGNTSEVDVAPADNLRDNVSINTGTITSGQLNCVSKIIQVDGSSQIYLRTRYVVAATVEIWLRGYYDYARL